MAAAKKLISKVAVKRAASPAKGRAIAASEPVAPKAKSAKRSKTAKPLAPERVAAILDALRKAYPDAVCALDHRNAWELTVATILSAQSTDAGVNLATPELFRQFPTPAALAAANPQAVEELIHRTGFYRAKTTSIMGAAKVVLRLSRRLELTRHEDPVKVELDLQKVIPQDRWIDFSHELIHHGRRVCVARKPRCEACALETVCNSGDKTWSSH